MVPEEKPLAQWVQHCIFVKDGNNPNKLRLVLAIKLNLDLKKYTHSTRLCADGMLQWPLEHSDFYQNMDQKSWYFNWRKSAFEGIEFTPKLLKWQYKFNSIKKLSMYRAWSRTSPWNIKHLLSFFLNPPQEWRKNRQKQLRKTGWHTFWFTYISRLHSSAKRQNFF